MTPSTQLGHYEILSALGKGGMGEVWRARDTKLGREVAIKTLPPEFAQDTNRLARFEREAKLLASLNHHNIAAIYGLEEHEGARFLVLELVEGDTLADRIKRGAIPVEESLKLALQIAEALEAAHEKGVIHRDLKPANIKVTLEGKIKVLDFGLAKAFAGEEADVNLSNSPTLSMQATQAGIILGTAAYMSPEQAKGLTADRRADVFSFGCVLFEMLTGRMAFRGELVSEILASVINQEPDYKALQENLHPRIKELLRRCFEKQPKDRWQAVGDVRVEIEQVLSDPKGLIKQPVADIVQAAPRSSLAVLVGIVIAAALAWNLKPADPSPVYRSDYEVPDGIGSSNLTRSILAVSPDGRHVVYNGIDGLYLRSMEQLRATRVEGTDGVTGPFFSPDSEWIGFVNSQFEIEKIAISGGDPIPVGPVQQSPTGISWGEDDMILFAQRDGIYRVPANGGEPTRVIASADGESFHGPRLLPGGRGILVTVGGTDNERDGDRIVVLSTDAPDARTEILPGSDATYVSTGHLIYAQGNDLLAIAFDLDTLEPIGSAVTMERGLGRSFASASANYGVSEDGSLVYLADTGTQTLILVWVGRDFENSEEPLSLPRSNYVSPRLSHDGGRVAVVDRSDGTGDVLVLDLTRNISTPVTSDATHEVVPLWTPDDDRIAFMSNRDGGQRGLFMTRADGTGTVDPLITGESLGNLMPYGWSADGSQLVFSYQDTGRKIGVLSMEGDRDWEPLIDSEGSELHPSISPDGRWIAYTLLRQDGEPDVFVDRFPELGNRNPISTGGGSQPVWSANGDELFFVRASDDAIMRVRVETGPELNPGVAQVVIEQAYFMGGGLTGGGPVVNYDYDARNRRFLMIKDAAAGDDIATIPRIITALNWFEELKERVPVP